MKSFIIDYTLLLLQVELIEPAVKGTLNVLKACCEVNVKKVVFVSSVAAIAVLPNKPTDRPMDETFWSDPDFCRSNNVISFTIMLSTIIQKVTQNSISPFSLSNSILL